MNVALVAGCAVAGLVTGGFLDSLTGRIVRDPGPPAERATELPGGPASGVGGGGTPPPAAVATRVPGALELAVTSVAVIPMAPLAAFPIIVMAS